MDRTNKQTELYTDNSRGSVSVHRNLPRSRSQQSNNYSKDHRGHKYHRYYKYLLAIGLNFVFPIQAYAEVGGVSATAAPVANSSGSVTNQAIQVLQGPYITNTYGAGIQCQGPTLNITPYVTGSASATKPYEPYYNDPVYDMRDLDDDGAPDNPGSVLYRIPVRTGQKDNYNLGVGFSATWSRPLDKKLQDQCKEAAAANIALMQQQTANKRLDFEIARLKNCGELIQKGIMFHPKSPYYSVCADVVVMNKNKIAPHIHSIPAPVSTKAEDLGGPIQTQD
ncbi:hypothetical protein RW03080701_162 [Synechococcus phage S-RIM8]|uniref:Gp165 n=1 Tax=Synechococcus phage S-RIM8 TaxID=756278 RepID=A0A1D7SA26_9CAUD|nr:hypothetical protein RW03080701_162 [Synechococcus phage S-RIM8]